MSRPMTFRKIDCTWFRPLARVVLMVCCLAGLPNLALASANSLFIEAFQAWEAAEQASSPLERLKLLEVCQAKLDEIVREHPNSDLAVQIVTRGKVGEFDLSLVAPALEEAKEEGEESDSVDLSEHIDHVIEDLQRQDFKAAWNLQLNFLVSNFQNISSRSRVSARSIMAWQIEREVSEGNISDAEDLAHVESIANAYLYNSYYYDGDSVLYHYLLEALLHNGYQEDVFRIISGLEGGLRQGAIDVAVVFLAKTGILNVMEQFLARYSHELQDNEMIEEIAAVLMERGSDPLVQALLHKTHDRNTKAKIRIEMAEAYLDRGELMKAEVTAFGEEIGTWDIHQTTINDYARVLYRLAGAVGQTGDVNKTKHIFELASELDPPKQSENRAQIVEALAKMGRIEEAKKLSGLSDPHRDINPKVLSAYFENLPTVVAIHELSNYKDYLSKYKETLVSPEGEIYFRFLIRHKQFDAVERILIDSSNNSSLDDKAVEKLYTMVSGYMDDDERQEYFLDWLQDLNQIRPSIDTTLHLVAPDSTAEQFSAGLNAIESITSKFDQQLFYWIFAQVAIDAEKLTINERSSFVADSLLQLIESVTNSFPSDRQILWNPLGEALRAMTLDRAEPEYWREWPAY